MVRPPASASTLRVRQALTWDGVLLPSIEDSAGELFRGLPDLHWIADDVSAPAAFHAALIAEGTVWVGESAEAGVVGFLTAQAFGSELHVWTLAVHRSFQRRGLGRRLIAAATEHARKTGLVALTLTTFRDVPWNGPFYRGLGFETADGARLEALLAQEAARGLPDRCALRLEVFANR